MMTKHGLEFMTMIIHPWLSEPTKQSYPLYGSFVSPPLGPDEPISAILYHIPSCSPKATLSVISYYLVQLSVRRVFITFPLLELFMVIYGLLGWDYID